MTIAKTDARKQYAGDDVTTAFAFPYRFFADSDLQVYLLVDATGVETLQTLTTHYTVSNNGDETGGTVTMVTEPATGETLTILRGIPQTQGTDYAANDSFPAETHESALDRLTLIDQQQEEVIGRTIKLPSSSSLTDIELPVPEAGKALQWDISETGLENSTATIDTAVVDAAASAAAALVSENAAAADLVLTNADVVSTNADVVLTNADVVTTTQDALDTAADAVSTAADVISAAASAAAADVAKIEWQGAWLTTTVYALNDAVEEAGSSYICIVAHTAGVFATDLAANKWELMAQKGAGSLNNVVEDLTPQLGGMLDVNGSGIGDGTDEIVKFIEAATPVNEFTMGNADAGSGPTLSATGDDTNVDLNVSPKGTGRTKLTQPDLIMGSDADGDVYYRSGGNLVRLAKGSDDDVLTLASGVPTWAASAGAMAQLAAVNVPSTTTVVTFTGLLGLNRLKVMGSWIGTSTPQLIAVQIRQASGTWRSIFESNTPNGNLANGLVVDVINFDKANNDTIIGTGIAWGDTTTISNSASNVNMTSSEADGGWVNYSGETYSELRILVTAGSILGSVFSNFELWGV